MIVYNYTKGMVVKEEVQAWRVVRRLETCSKPQLTMSRDDFVKSFTLHISLLKTDSQPVVSELPSLSKGAFGQ